VKIVDADIARIIIRHPAIKNDSSAILSGIFAPICR
jgi:hypothetical protein